MTFRTGGASPCCHPPFSAPGPSRLPVTWEFSIQDRVLGGVAPPHSPVRLDRISPGERPARTLEESDALVTWCKSPGQRAISDKVELGESNPSAGLYVVPGQGLSALPRIRFRVPPVTASDLEWPGVDALLTRVDDVATTLLVRSAGVEVATQGFADDV